MVALVTIIAAILEFLVLFMGIKSDLCNYSKNFTYNKAI